MSFDLQVPHDASQLKQLLLFAMRFGWDGAAISIVLDKSRLNVSPSSIADVNMDSIMSQDCKDEFSGEMLAKLRQHRGLPAFVLLKRATVKVAEPLDLHSMAKATSLNAFDLLAVRPETDDMFIKCCESAMVDIISLDFSFRGNWSTVTSRHVDKAVKRGVFFEIAACHAFKSKDTDRTSFFSNVRKMIHACRGKNIIFSGGASEWHEVRGPNDFENVAFLCGLDAKKAHDALGKNIRECVARGKLRSQAFRGAIGVVVDDGKMTVESAYDNIVDNAEDNDKKKKKKKKKDKKKKDKKKKEEKRERDSPDDSKSNKKVKSE